MRMMLGKGKTYNREMLMPRSMSKALSSLLTKQRPPAAMSEKGQLFKSTMADRENKKSQTMLTKTGVDGGQEAKSSSGSKESTPVAPIKTELKAPPAPVKPMTAEEAEEKRMQEIDEIAPAVNDDELVREAKYGNLRKGIFPYSASELALKALQKKAQDSAYSDIDIGVAAAKGSIQKHY